jgi:hypothetical protein
VSLFGDNRNYLSHGSEKFVTGGMRLVFQAPLRLWNQIQEHKETDICVYTLERQTFPSPRGGLQKISVSEIYTNFFRIKVCRSPIGVLSHARLSGVPLPHTHDPFAIASLRSLSDQQIATGEKFFLLRRDSFFLEGKKGRLATPKTC